MKKIDNWDNINENGELKVLKPGVYPIKITGVIDNADKEYLEVFFDIVDGEFKGYFGDLSKNSGKDYSRTIRSYKESALGFFKRFITAIEKSNNNYKWDWNEKGLVGKFCVGEFGEEEYLTQDNEIKTIVKIQNFRSGESYREGKCKTPELKKLSDEERAKAKNVVNATVDDIVTFTEVKKDSLPF